MIATLLGIPPTELAQFKQWSDDLVATFNSPDKHAPDATREEMNRGRRRAGRGASRHGGAQRPHQRLRR